MGDMKQLLLKLGHRLVENHGFKPTTANFDARESGKTTGEVLRFLIWLDKTPEAREELERMGYSFVRTNPIGRL